MNKVFMLFRTVALSLGVFGSVAVIAQNDCATALPITCGSTVTGTTVGAPTNVPSAASCGTTYGTNGGQWYTFTGGNDVVTASLCGSSYDSKIHIISGSCAAQACVVGNDDFCGLQSQVTFNATAGVQYFIYVNGFSTSSGAYTLNLSCTPIAFGCTDPIACNFDPAATTNDGSCDYVSCAGCTDPTACNFDPAATLNTGCDYSCIGCDDPAACNYSAAVTINDGSCCFDNCVTLTVGGGSFPGEVGWSLVDAGGAVVAVGGVGTFDLCLADGCYQYVMTDSFGDGWNGNTYNFVLGGSSIGSGNLDNAEVGDGESTGTDLIVINGGCTPGCTDPGACNFDPAADFNWACDFTSCAGCTDILATNYDPAATIDDGSCVFCGAGEILAIIDMTDSFGDGWNGALYAVTTTTGTVIATGDLNTASFGDGVSVGQDAFCMAPGCYILSVTGGSFAAEIGWTFSDQLGNVYGSGGAPTTAFNIDFGFTGGCGFSGCTDPNCIGYNPSATIDDGSCLCPPANNNVCDAEAIGCGVSVAGTLANATDNEGLIGSLCGGTAVTTAGVWYSYDAAADEQVTVSACNSVGVTDTKLHVYLGAPDCNNLVCVASNDDGCGAGNFLSSVTFNAQTGNDYYILVSKFSTFTTGDDFTLDVSCVSCGAFPANDDCATAQPVISGLTITASLCCAGPANAPNFAAGFATAYDVWYSFNSNDYDTFFFDVTNVSGGNVGLMFYTGDCSAPDDFVGCLVTGQCAGDISDFLTLTPNTDYYFSIFTTLPDQCGDYELSVLGVYLGCTDPVANNYDAQANTDDGSCDYAGVVNPLDLCADAAVVTCNTTVNGTTGGATAVGAPTGLACDIAPGSGVWYQFAGTGDYVTISTCGSVIDSKINVWESVDCAGPFSCVSTPEGGFASETTDFGSCGFFDQDDASVSFISTAGTNYYIYISAQDVDGNPLTDDNGTFVMDISCEPVVLGCTNPVAYNYNAAANIEDGSCDFFSGTCTAGGTALLVNMTDSFGDGWNGATYTITDGTGATIASGDLDGADFFVDEDNFAGPESGFDFLCLQDGCYTILVGGGIFDIECGFSIVDANGTVYASGGAGTSIGFTIGAAVCGCTDSGACNFDPAATDEDGSCEYVSCAGCTDPTACNFDATATIEDGSCCFDNCATFIMNDSFGDGWNGAIYEIFTIDGTFVASGDLDNAQSGDGSSTGTDILCLADGCYTLNVTGGTFPGEVSWTLFGSNTGVISGGANASVNFSVGSGACITGCTEPVACNYDPAANIADCEACDYSSCFGCTYMTATNYDPAAGIDDGTCIFDIANPCPEDLNGDGIVNAGDLLQFLGAFGTTCN